MMGKRGVAVKREGVTTKEKNEEMLWVDVTVLYLECGSGYMNVCICLL